jgi:hypothetical protein
MRKVRRNEASRRVFSMLLRVCDREIAKALAISDDRVTVALS